MEDEWVRFILDKNVSSKDNSKNSKVGTSRHVRCEISLKMTRMLAAHGIYPRCKPGMQDHFKSLWELTAYWVDKNESFQNAANAVWDRMRGPASSFSSELGKQGTNQAIGFNIAKQLIPVSRIIPMLFLQCQAIADNFDPSKTDKSPFLLGGSVNGKAPQVRSKIDPNDNTKKIPPTEIEKLANCFLYRKDIKQSPNKGFQIITDTQCRLSTVTARKSNPKIPVIVDFELMAFALFEIESPSIRKSELYNETYVEKLDAILAVVPNDGYDIASVSRDQALEDNSDQNAKSDEVKVSNQKMLRRDVVSAVMEMSRLVEEVHNKMDSSAPSGGENLNFRSAISDSIEGIEKAVTGLAEKAKMSGHSSCKTILLHEAIAKIILQGESIDATAIYAYLNLALPRQPSELIGATPSVMTSKTDLESIVVNFGYEYNENMPAFARQNHLMSSANLQKGLAAVELIGANKSNAFRLLSDEDDDGVITDYTNIFDTATTWTAHGWTSNLIHMKENGKNEDAFSSINRVIWVNRKVMQDLTTLVADGDEHGDDSDSNDETS